MLRSRLHPRLRPPQIAIPTPPRTRTASPLGLLEELFCDRPWELLLSCMLLNKTTRRQVDPVLTKFLGRWPSPDAAARAEIEQLEATLRPLGFGANRARSVQRMSSEFIVAVDAAAATGGAGDSSARGRESVGARGCAAWRIEPRQLYGIGEYAEAAFELFCVRNAQRECQVCPADHALASYVLLLQGGLLTAETEQHQ